MRRPLDVVVVRTLVDVDDGKATLGASAFHRVGYLLRVKLPSVYARTR